MRNFLTLFYVCISFCCYPQFFDDFSESASINNKNWQGNLSHFLINSDNQLQLSNAGNAATSYLSALFKPEPAFIFECKVTFRFNPSKYNYSRIYIMADQRDLSKPLTGYFILLGGSNDEVSLYYQKGLTETALISSKKRILDTRNEITIRLERDDTNRWQLASKINAEPDFAQEGECTDSRTELYPNFGPLCTYSKTYSEKFYFDYFKISNGTPDPEEKPDPGGENPGPGGENPDPGEEQIGKIGFHDVVISEIMANPKGITGLPEVEYVELYNRTEEEINLKGCTFYYDVKKFVLPAYKLQAAKRVIMCHAEKASLFPASVPLLPIPSFPVLANSGKLLLLENPANEPISWVAYSDKWYGDSQKSQGGFSLEIIDPENPMPTQQNWSASVSTQGGTPGTENSIDRRNPDLDKPLLVRHSRNESGHISLDFNLPMGSFEHCQIVADPPNEKMNFLIEVINYPYGNQVLLVPDRKATNEPLELTVSNLTSLSGNPLQPRLPLHFTTPKTPLEGDLVINEILFNPLPGTLPFVELYNNSDKLFDLNELKLCKIETSGEIGTVYPLSEGSSYINPHEYVLIHCDPISLFRLYQYEGEPLVVSPARLTLSKSGGRIGLLDGENNCIDRVTYHDRMHTAPTTDRSGISLERIDFEEESELPLNWQSANSANRGNATPGYQNSSPDPDLSLPVDEAHKPGFWLPYPAVGLSGTANERPLTVHYRLNEAGYVATFSVYDTKGILIGRPAVNLELIETGEISWNSEWYNKRMPVPGIYILLIEYFNLKGAVHRTKLPFPVTP